jgi:hypothetical protein
MNTAMFKERVYTYFCLLATVPLVTSCVTPPTNDVDAIAKIKSITIFCCDHKNRAPLLPESNVSTVVSLASAFTGGALGAIVAATALDGATDVRTRNFYDAARVTPFEPHQPFLQDVVSSLEASGTKVVVRFPSYFDGYNNRYQYEIGEVSTDAVLEIRQLTAIAQTGDRYYPTVGASYRLLDSKRRTLTDGVVGSSDPSQQSSWYEVHPFGAPALNAVMMEARSQRTKPHLLKLSDERIVVGDSGKLYAEAKTMYQALVDTNREVATRLAQEVLMRK